MITQEAFPVPAGLNSEHHNETSTDKECAASMGVITGIEESIVTDEAINRMDLLPLLKISKDKGKSVVINPRPTPSPKQRSPFPPTESGLQNQPTLTRGFKESTSNQIVDFMGSDTEAYLSSPLAEAVPSPQIKPNLPTSPSTTISMDPSIFENNLAINPEPIETLPPIIPTSPTLPTTPITQQFSAPLISPALMAEPSQHFTLPSTLQQLAPILRDHGLCIMAISPSPMPKKKRGPHQRDQNVDGN